MSRKQNMHDRQNISTSQSTPAGQSNVTRSSAENPKNAQEKLLNRDQIKFIAIAAMTCNHFARVFLTPDTVVYNAMLVIGYFTAIIMCYFLVEGMRYTSSQSAYGKRLLIFAFISQIPYQLVHNGIDGLTDYSDISLNMMFTLYLCYLICIVWDSNYGKALKCTFYAVLTLTSVICDWALLAPLFTLLFLWARDGNAKAADRMTAATIICAGLLAYNNSGYGVWVSVGCFFIAILAGLILKNAYNGQRAAGADENPAMYKWFFYFYYPLHMLILVFVHMVMVG